MERRVKWKHAIEMMRDRTPAELAAYEVLYQRRMRDPDLKWQFEKNRLLWDEITLGLQGDDFWEKPDADL